MLGHNAVQQHDDEKLQHNWKDKFQLSDKYTIYRKQLLDMLTEFQSTWDGHLSQMNTAKHRINLTPRNTQPIHSASNPTVSKAAEFGKAEIHKMLSQKVIQPVRTEWAAPTILAPEKDRPLLFWVDYYKLNAVVKRDSNPKPRMDECIDSLREAVLLPILEASSVYW